jgi:hypothetical protein
MSADEIENVLAALALFTLGAVVQLTGVSAPFSIAVNVIVWLAGVRLPLR